MIRDGIFKAICIPLLGVAIPWAAHLFCCPQPSGGYLITTVLFFSFTALIVWQTAVLMLARLRTAGWLQSSFPLKIMAMAAASMLLSAAWGTCAGWLWQRVVSGFSPPSLVLHSGLLYAALGLLLSLLYEALFLSKERELDEKIVNQLDRERVQAEITALKAELDPHFIFNALTTVAYLAAEAPQTARAFTQKLAQVYKYFLINKDRELITLQDELRLIEDYFFLLQIRYENSVRLHLQVPEDMDTAMIVPCALQLLVENAIKHNRFSEQEPLNIHIQVAGAHIMVANERRRKSYPADSTRIGLLHLRQHYRLLCNLDIEVEEAEHFFKVQIPLIKQRNL